MTPSGPRPLNPGQNRKYLIAYPQCSCPKCDSLYCFTRRQYNKPCSCHKCQNSKTCLYFPYKGSNASALVGTVKPMEGDEILLKERVKREITYEYDEVLKTRNVSKHVSKSMFSSDKDRGIAEKYNNKDYPSRHVHNVAIKISHKEHCSSAARLSEQNMNATYENIHDKNFTKTPETTKYKLSAYDVLKKIRDAYKACSCKVCECLVGKSLVTENKLCKCQPCNCKDCMTFLSKFQYLKDLEKEPPDGCPCIRCTRSQCKGIANRFNEPQICDCPPSNSIKCETYTKACNCKPCQCLECKAMSIQVPKTFTVAPFEEQYQRHYCECSPCECIECGGYGTPSRYISEAATNGNRLPCCQCNTCVNEACISDGSPACKCEHRSRIMAKPVEKHDRSYDIRAMVTKKNVLRSKNMALRNNTIAMYARVPNLYDITHYKKACSCDVCHCVICNCKESAVESIKSSRLFKDSYKIPYTMLNLASKACKCFPCECQICAKKIESKNKSNQIKLSVNDNCQSDSSIKLYDSHRKNTAQRDTVTYCEYPQNYRSTNKTEYILLPGKKTQLMLPKRGNIKYTIKNVTSNYAERNYKNSKFNEMKIKYADSPLSHEVNYHHDSTVPVVTEGELCSNSCDSGCGSFDYFTVFPISQEQTNQERNKVKSSSDTIFITDDARPKMTQRFYNTSYLNAFNENQGHDQHNFESEKKCYFSKYIKDKNNSITHSRKRMAGNSAHQKVYDHQYWIKNIEVSVTVRDQSNGNYSMYENSRSNSMYNLNTIQDNDENLSYSANISDHSHSSCSKKAEDLPNNDAYNEGARKTLHRARAFTLQLMNILEKYERANNEFQSITQKLKPSHASLLKENILEEPKDKKDNVFI